MQYRYVVILKKDSERATDALSVLLCLFSAFSFTLAGVRALDAAHRSGGAGGGSNMGAPGTAYVSFALAAILLIGLVINLLLRRPSRATLTGRPGSQDNSLASAPGSSAAGSPDRPPARSPASHQSGARNRPRYRYWLLIAAIGWIGTTATPWVGAFFFVLAFLEYQTKRPLEIGFHDDRIVINTLVKQRFDWSDFNNIILKDGLLTLDFSNNRLMQKEVAEDDDEDDADEDEFNAFCRSRLAAAGHLPA